MATFAIWVKQSFKHGFYFYCITRCCWPFHRLPHFLGIEKKTSLSTYCIRCSTYLFFLNAHCLKHKLTHTDAHCSINRWETKKKQDGAVKLSARFQRRDGLNGERERHVWERPLSFEGSSSKAAGDKQRETRLHETNCEETKIVRWIERGENKETSRL